MNFFDTVIEVLKQNEGFFSAEGELLRNSVYEAAMKMDADLLKMLYNNEVTRERFFTNIDGISVFDKVGFGWVINNREFLPDSYTRYKNKIGLTNSNGDYISTSNDVELVFPYKDCVLEGGQTKEDQKRSEIFYNETLAPDEVDRLLYPKVLTNAKRYTANGIEENISSFEDSDNLIIKGNNLLSLSSLLVKYERAIKCIYIDPPYNTGDDDFNYNDNFNHSSWLTFMRNRLTIAKRLLRDDGAIFVHIDHHELGYLNILMDEIFGIENKVQIISVKTASPAGFKTVNPGPIDVTEYILFYTKCKSQFKFKKAYVPVGYNKNYNLVVKKEEKVSDWTFEPIKQAVIKDAGFESEKEAKQKYGKAWNVIVANLIEQYAYNNADNVVSIRDPHKPTDALKRLMQESKKVDEVLEYKREDGSSGYIYKGGALAFYSNKLQMVDGHLTVTELLSDFWSHISWAGIANEGGVKLKNGKKPEKLIKQIFELSTEAGDIVLDYHLGCGTTCAVAHKMGLKYIGCEQLDYGQNDSVVRLNNVINGDTTGISTAVNWQGGGSFVYCELAKMNQKYVDDIQTAATDTDIVTIWREMMKTGFISCKVNPKDIDMEDVAFTELSLDDKKRFLMELLDKNQLYVNYCDMEDETFAVSDADKAFTKSFYGVM